MFFRQHFSLDDSRKNHSGKTTMDKSRVKNPACPCFFFIQKLTKKSNLVQILLFCFVLGIKQAVSKYTRFLCLWD